MRLSDIVTELCLSAGLVEDEFDVSALDDYVAGYVVTERTSVREMIAVLQTAYFFDAVETGGVPSSASAARESSSLSMPSISAPAKAM